MPPVEQGNTQQAEQLGGMDDPVTQRCRVNVGVIPEPADAEKGQQRDARRGGPTEKAPGRRGGMSCILPDR